MAFATVQSSIITCPTSTSHLKRDVDLGIISTYSGLENGMDKSTQGENQWKLYGHFKGRRIEEQEKTEKDREKVIQEVGEQEMNSNADR
ncbi:hypothetical protein P7K49_019746, partial [Saguinus oedipus]